MIGSLQISLRCSIRPFKAALRTIRWSLFRLRLRLFLRHIWSLDRTLQAALLLLSIAAIWLVAQPAPLMRWGYVVGMASQPFWFAATWRARQWGMFTLAIFYTGAWLAGIHNHF